MVHKIWDSFRDELVATGFVLIAATVGSFWFVRTLFSREELIAGPPPTPTQTIAQKTMSEMVKVLGEKNEPEISESQIVPTVEVLTPEATPTGNVTKSEVLYGVGGLYENSAYRLEINSPRLVEETSGNGSRKLVVDLVLYNKAVSDGLPNQVSASIVKDGVIIVPDAAMSLSESVVVKPNEKISYQAKISLITGTDVKEFHYKPINLPPIVHQLLP